MQRFFPIIFSIALISVGFGFLLLFLAEYFIPAWQEFLALSNPWLCALFVLIVCPLIGLAKLPISFRFSDVGGSINLLSVIFPFAILAYIYPSLNINWTWAHLAPAILSFFLFLSCSYPSQKGAVIYRFVLPVSAIGSLFVLHAVLGHHIQEFLWLAFASQFIPLLIVDFVRTSQSAKLMDSTQAFCIGQGGAKAPLWVAPSFALFISYLAHEFFWKTNSSFFG